MALPAPDHRNPEATVWCGDLDPQVDESLLWELMLQAGPVVSVHIPRDKLSQQHSGYGFVEFKTEDDADYAINIMRMVKLYNRPLKVNKSSKDKRDEARAVLFIGSLAPDVDEKTLSDAFSAFGPLATTPKIMYDPETGASKGYGFVAYETFAASDLAIQEMDNQFFAGKVIRVSYAYKKDGKKGERHGSQEERQYVESRFAVVAAARPNRVFSVAPGTISDASSIGAAGMGAPAAPVPTPSSAVPAPPMQMQMPTQPQYMQQPPQPQMFQGFPPPPNPYGGQMPPMPQGGPPFGFAPPPPPPPGMGFPHPGQHFMGPPGMMPPPPGMQGMAPPLPPQGFIPPPPQPPAPRPPPM
eukprot:TRINITY_DN129_c1_g5_i1.p1 TRINITY_DN129_c1_g5~~TRINITY_DN129_c1_g5_i1.p1  ORF type:complete len:355 (-),score=70.25 TRINITY_DN129_c1_g5_i1:122-1186(-)